MVTPCFVGQQKRHYQISLITIPVHQISIKPRASSAIADITLTISSVQPRITASTTVKVLSAKIDVEVKLDLEVNQLSS